MAGSKHGLILRSAAEHGDDTLILKDIEAQRAAADLALGATEPGLVLDGPGAWALGTREWQGDQLDEQPGSFARHNVLDLLAPFTSTRFGLSGGAYGYIEPTRALVAVDVNTGADMSPAAGLKANLALVRELSTQLLVRGLGGQIVIDCAPMAKRDRAGFDSSLRTALRADPVETALVGWTQLGHYELQRKRERLPVDFTSLT
jgi:Ribonuclease G/E